MSRWTSLIGALLSQIKCREIRGYFRWIRDFFYQRCTMYFSFVYRRWRIVSTRKLHFFFFFYLKRRIRKRNTLLVIKRNYLREISLAEKKNGRKFSRRQMFDEHEINCSSRPVPFCRAGLGIKCQREEGPLLHAREILSSHLEAWQSAYEI